MNYWNRKYNIFRCLYILWEPAIHMDWADLLLVTNCNWFFAKSQVWLLQVIFMCVYVVTPCLCETAKSLKARKVSPNFPHSLGPTWHTSFRTIWRQGQLTWGWEHKLQPESRPEECQWTSCPRVPSGQKEMPSQLLGK